MPSPFDEPTPPSSVKVAGVVSFYMISGLVVCILPLSSSSSSSLLQHANYRSLLQMVFVNKAVMTSTPDLPFTFLVRTNYYFLVLCAIRLHLIQISQILAT
jgi:hypothetical protein